MLSRFPKYFICVLILVNSITGSRAQTGLCPPNMDFEMGDFTNWFCQSGQVSATGGSNTITWFSSGPIPGKHTIIDATTSGTDYYGSFPELCPNGSGFSVILGNTGTGREADGVSYTYTIPADATVFSIFYHYAVVLQNPNHSPEEQPRFRARIVDLSTNLPLPCVTFDFTASSSLPGFVQSRIDPTVLYKDWTPITLNLSAYAGRTILLEFITSDCTLGGHFGYAYLDVNTACNGVISGSTICIGDTSLTLTAPFGFQSYTWYSDVSYSTVISTSQSITLTPPPSVGSVFPVVVIPYPGFGCTDTLFATITISPRPVSDAGADVIVCQGQQAQIGAPPLIGHTYLWSPSAQVSNPISSNPFAWSMSPNPEEFIVKTTDLLTGCFSYDTTYINTRRVDTSIRLTGLGGYCLGDPNAGTLSVSTSVSSVQWYDANGPIPGATGSTYNPVVDGDYWAQITDNGCIDSTSTIPIRIHAIP